MGGDVYLAQEASTYARKTNTKPCAAIPRPRTRVPTARMTSHPGVTAVGQRSAAETPLASPPRNSSASPPRNPPLPSPQHKLPSPSHVPIPLPSNQVAHRQSLSSAPPPNAAPPSWHPFRSSRVRLLKGPPVLLHSPASTPQLHQPHLHLSARCSNNLRLALPTQRTSAPASSRLRHDLIPTLGQRNYPRPLPSARDGHRGGTRIKRQGEKERRKMASQGYYNQGPPPQAYGSPPPGQGYYQGPPPQGQVRRRPLFYSVLCSSHIYLWCIGKKGVERSREHGRL